MNPQIRSSLTWLALAASTFLAGCGVDADDTAHHRPLYTPDGEGIVFMSNRGGDWELYRANRDGTAVVRLTNHEGWDGYADISLDGTKIVFDRSGEEGEGPFLMNIDGSEARPLGQYRHKISGTRFSPDGRRIVAFEEVNERRDLWLLHAAEGRKLEELTHTPDQNEHDASFSPDGQYIAFAVVLDAGSALEIMHLGSKQRQRVFESAGNLYGVNWHPRGEALVFNAPDGEDQDLFLVNRDGSHLIQLTDNDTADHLASWHPNGEEIIFTSERNGNEAIHLMHVGDKTTTQLALEMTD